MDENRFVANALLGGLFAVGMAIAFEAAAIFAQAVGVFALSASRLIQAVGAAPLEILATGAETTAATTWGDALLNVFIPAVIAAAVVMWAAMALSRNAGTAGAGPSLSSFLARQFQREDDVTVTFEDPSGASPEDVREAYVAGELDDIEFERRLEEAMCAEAGLDADALEGDRPDTAGVVLSLDVPAQADAVGVENAPALDRSLDEVPMDDDGKIHMQLTEDGWEYADPAELEESDE